ncbi:MAG: FMN-binding glutamate synthase family protein [Actinobacteria bacterium HGW-Actinobacteria-1]|jgi:glutamate synthase domain-containing protein 2|nr:MAG: FMN-binding glutamate synthase family protein [Actinobacteria bacterium HGW-Actinobacteria-1]
MPTSFIQPEFKVKIDYDKCHKCGRCVQQCGWGVYNFNERPIPDDAKCRACHRCVTYCPAHCISIEKNQLAYRDNDNWSPAARKAVWRQAETGGVLLTSMGNPLPYTRIFDHLVLDACQVTNPSIDPLREPMELRTFIGHKPDSVGVESDGQGGFRLAEGEGMKNNLKLDTPILFSPMSYGSVSLNVHKSLAMAAQRLGTFMNTGEGGLHADLYPYQDNVIVQVASGRFGVNPDYLNRGAAIEIKIGQGAKPGIGGHLPGEKINKEVSGTRMIPQGTDAISPAPHHDIYSIEDLRQLIYALKEASGYKPVGVKIAAVHNVAAIASGIVRAGADYVYLDGFKGGTGAAPQVIRDHIGIPIEIAIAAVDQRLRDEGIRNWASVIAAGSIRSSADVAKAIALGADAVAIGSASLMALGCHLCQSCHTGSCSWGITTQKPELTRRIDPEWGAEQLTNLVHAWSHELQEILGALGVNAVESLRGSRERLRSIGLDEQMNKVLGVKPAGM